MRHLFKFSAFVLAFVASTAAYAQNTTLTNHAFAIGKGPGVSGYTSLLCSVGQIAIGSSADPVCASVSGDATLSASGVVTLGTVNSTPGAFGGPNSIPSFTVDGKGRITIAAANVPAIPFTELTGSLACSQRPALTGFVTAAAGSCATALGGTVPFSSVTGTVPVLQGGTGQTTATLGFAALAPTPVRAGDLMYYNGTNWVTLPGNNSGTQFLQETAAGVPSWATISGTGTLTTLTAGAGISFSSGATCTTTCTVSVNQSTFTNALGANVAMNVTANYFDGPSVAQGTSGTWLATGQVSLSDTVSANAVFICKLWDGTTVIASGAIIQPSAAANLATLTLVGAITSPAGNIKISCRDTSSINGLINFNASGNSKDSTLSVLRVQ